MKNASFNKCIIVALSKRYLNVLRGLQQLLHILLLLHLFERGRKVKGHMDSLLSLNILNKGD